MRRQKKNNWVLVQDTAWEGYEDIPQWIMQGYMTMAYETYNSLKAGNKVPTHVFLQGGVGSLAAAVTGFFANVYDDNLPIFTIVEPSTADCLLRSAEVSERIAVGKDMKTIMAGLACGEPNTMALDVLFDYAKNYISVTDKYAAHGMRVLGAPMGNDPRIISGESGAAPFGTIIKIFTDESLKKYRETLIIDENSILLFFNTEGDTDKKNYRDVVWDGVYCSL